MRAAFGWGLAATVAMTAVAEWTWPADPADRAGEDSASPATALAVDGREAPLPARAADRISGDAAPALPARLPKPVYATVAGDPFQSAAVAPPPAPPTDEPLAPPPAPPAPPPEAPPLDYRYIGRMTDPSGARRVYLTKNDTPLAVAVGSVLDEGYVVRAMDATGIRLRLPAQALDAFIPIPAQAEAATP